MGSSITSLDVSHNNGGPLSSIELTQVCGQDQLTELDASWNTLRGEDSSALVLAVAGNMTLTALNVSFNALGRRCPTDDWSTMFTKNKVKWFILYEYINRYIRTDDWSIDVYQEQGESETLIYLSNSFKYC